MSKPPKKRTKVRRRNAVATRQAILGSALRAFAEKGYDGVGLREIAEGIGVTAMLVHHYFGSKEELFSEVVARAVATPSIFTQENIASADPSEVLATTLLKTTDPDREPLDGFLIFLHSASTRRAAKITREKIEQHQHKALAAVVSGDHADARAALVLAVIAGIQIMRQMIGLAPLAKAEPEVLAKLIAPMLRQLIGK